MTIRSIFTICCDGNDCGSRILIAWPKGSVTRGNAEAKVRLKAQKEGWGYVGGDLCPDCVAKFIYEENGCVHRTRESVG